LSANMLTLNAVYENHKTRQTASNIVHA